MSTRLAEFAVLGNSGRDLSGTHLGLCRLRRRSSASLEFEDFEQAYDLRVHGPNGFFREFKGAAGDPLLAVSFKQLPPQEGGTLEAILELRSRDPRATLIVLVDDLSYGIPPARMVLGPSGAANSTAALSRNLAQSFGWYDLRVRVEGAERFEQRYAGRIEAGRDGFSDPRMGGV